MRRKLNNVSVLIYIQCYIKLLDPSRNVSDVEDGHQRICLHAEVLTPAGSRVSQQILSCSFVEKSVYSLDRILLGSSTKL